MSTTKAMTIHIREGVPVEEAKNAIAMFAEWVGRDRFDYTAGADGKIILWSENAWNVGYAIEDKPEQSMWQWKHGAYESDLFFTEEEAYKQALRMTTGADDDGIAVRQVGVGEWRGVNYKGYME